jgi:predicted amidohydrolase YtcJ
VKTLVLSECVAAMSGPEMNYAAGGVLVEGDRIVEVVQGAKTQVLARCGDAVQVDVGDRPVLPGFVDAHVHLEAFAEAVGLAVDCHSPPCRSVDDVLQTLRDHRGMSQHNEGWLIGQGSLFQDQRLTERRLPTRKELDSVDRRTPIVFRPGGHTLVLNTAALELAMANPRFAALPAALLERDPDGSVSGVLREVELAAGMLPVPAPDRARKKALLRAAIAEHFTARGVTSVVDMSSSLEDLRALDDLIASGDVATRCSSFPIIPRVCAPEAAFRLRSSVTFASPSDRLAVRGLKFFLDGGISSGLAAIHQHYTHKRSRGRLNIRKDRLAQLVRSADAEGLDLAFHTMGERAQDALTDALLAVRPANIAVRAEHAGTIVTRPLARRRWRDAGLTPVPNTPFIYTLADFIPPALQLARRQLLQVLPLRSMLAEGWIVPGASDATGSEILHANPFFGVQTAVTRRTYAGEVADADEALTVAQALHGATAGSAAVCGDLSEKGTLAAGKLADLVVLESDPLRVPPAQLHAIRPYLVMIGGRWAVDRRHEPASG